MEENTNPTPGTTVAPTVGDTLNGSSAPAESAFDHAEDKVESSIGKLTEASASPVQAAHEQLIKNQISLFEKVSVLAKRLEDVLARPFGGEQAAEKRDSYGSSPVAKNLNTSTGITDNTHAVVDHLLNNLEV